MRWWDEYEAAIVIGGSILLILELLMLVASGCATHVQLWPPQVDVAIGDAYAGVDDDCDPSMDCSLARGGELSPNGRRFFYSVFGTARSAAGAFLGVPVPPPAVQPEEPLPEPVPEPIPAPTLDDVGP